MWQGRRETERGREDWERANRDKIGDRKKQNQKINAENVSYRIKKINS